MRTRKDGLLNITWVPLAVGVVPLLTGIICYWISSSAGTIPDCNPLLEGCTTISSAGRYGYAYGLFKAGMIPAAVLLGFFWPLCRRWFLAIGGTDSPGLRAMARLGAISAAFLILYSLFLGSQGDFYSLMRRFGVTIYFSFSYLAQVLLLNRLWDERRTGRIDVPNYISTWMFAITLLMLAMGLYSIPVGEMIPDPDDRVINIIEWNFALLLSGWYLLPWLAWRRTRFRL